MANNAAALHIQTLTHLQSFLESSQHFGRKIKLIPLILIGINQGDFFSFLLGLCVFQHVHIHTVYVPQVVRGELPAGLRAGLLHLVEGVWGGAGEELAEEEAV